MAAHDGISREDILDTHIIHPGVRAGRKVCLEQAQEHIAAIAASM